MRFSIVAALCLPVLACSPLDDEPFTPTEDNNSGGDDEARFEIFGTTPAPASDWIVYDTECDTAVSTESPGLQIADVHLPREWKVIGISPGRSLRFENDVAERALEVGYGEYLIDSPGDVLLSRLFGGDFEIVGQVQWGQRSYPVGFDGKKYAFIARAGRVQGGPKDPASAPDGAFEYWFHAQFGHLGTGDVESFGRATILKVLDSLSLNACTLEKYAPVMQMEDKVVIVD